MTGRYYFPETTGPGAALADFDGDGDLDALLLQGGLLGGAKLEDVLIQPRPPELRDRLYRNDLEILPGGGRRLTFTDVTEGSGLAQGDYGMGVAVGDVDNDGLPDLYVTNFGPNRLYRNLGGGRFEDVTERSGTDDPRWSVPAAFFDYDRDGWLDLFVGNYVRFTVATHKECRAETGAPDYCGPLAYPPEPDRLFRNRGDGTFEDVSLASGVQGVVGAALGALPADFDGDGWLDLYVANDGTANALWRNRGDGTFEELAMLGGSAVNADGVPEASMGVDAADFDRDGDEDLFMTHLDQETNTLYVNDGHGFFTDATVPSGLGNASWTFTGFGTAWVDVDNDGWLDVFVANGAVEVLEDQRAQGVVYPLKQRNQLFLGLGDGRFEEVSERAGPPFQRLEASRAAAFGDVDNDGDVDVLVGNNCGPAELLVNRVGQDAPWIGLRLVGPGTPGGPPRDQLGAWVGVERQGAATLWRRVRTAGSFAAANDPRLLFGLGDGGPAEITGVRVRWPDGTEERFGALPAGEYHTLRQGTGSPSPAPPGGGS